MAVLSEVEAASAAEGEAVEEAGVREAADVGVEEDVGTATLGEATGWTVWVRWRPEVGEAGVGPMVLWEAARWGAAAVATGRGEIIILGVVLAAGVVGLVGPVRGLAAVVACWGVRGEAVVLAAAGAVDPPRPDICSLLAGEEGD